MNASELREKYTMLYDYMSTSKKTEYMMAFGKVMSEMMDDMIANSPSKAEEYIDKLCAIKWQNYLTQKEADKIVSSMNPKAPWSRDVWRNAMDSFGLEKEDSPCYNSCAMWVTMNMVYSDHAETLAKAMGKNLQDIPTEQLVRTIYALSIDLLCDSDKNFNIRRYFGL